MARNRNRAGTPAAAGTSGTPAAVAAKSPAAGIGPDRSKLPAEFRIAGTVRTVTPAISAAVAAAAAEPFAAKSDAIRAAFAAGGTVTVAAAAVGSAVGKPVSYGFAYGIAARAGIAEFVADRRSSARVRTSAAGVSVRTANGIVTVRPDGTISRRRG